MAKNNSEEINFQFFVDGVKQKQISWNIFIDFIHDISYSDIDKLRNLNKILLMELSSLNCLDIEKLKYLNTILLTGFKNHIQKEHAETEMTENDHLQNLQKSNANQILKEETFHETNKEISTNEVIQVPNIENEIKDDLPSSCIKEIIKDTVVKSDFDQILNEELSTNEGSQEPIANKIKDDLTSACREEVIECHSTTNPKIFLCGICDKEYNIYFHLKKHIQKAHHDEQKNEYNSGDGSFSEYKKLDEYEIATTNIKSLFKMNTNTIHKDNKDKKSKYSLKSSTLLSNSDDDDDIQEGPFHKLPRGGRGRRRRYIQTETGWECVECGMAMSKRQYMRGHYLECMGRGKALLNLPKELVEKGGIEKNKGEEGGEKQGAPDTKKVKHEDVLKCYGCKHVYRSLVEMKGHLASYDHCSASTWVCNDCPKTFGADRSLRIHNLQIHQTELICDICAKNFETNHKKFLRHLQRAHITEGKKKDGMYKCDECARSFDYEKNFERHMAKHKAGTLKPGETKQQKEYVCNKCNKVYGNYKSFFCHVKTHTFIYECQNCSKNFSTPRGLKYHMALHTGIREFHCKECDKEFITQDKLTLHQKSRHSNERPHACDWCGKGFLLAHKLAEHERRVHTGEKPFKCNKCDQRFTDSSALSHHRTKCHASNI